MAHHRNRGYSNPQHQSSPGMRSAQQGAAGNIGQSASGVMDTVKETAQEWASNVTSTAEDAWDSTREGARQVVDRAEDALDNVGQFIKRYPVASLLFACCVGFVVSEAMHCMAPSDRSMNMSSRF